MRVVMLGAPGCGKGTQTKMMLDKFGGVHISTGDLLRAAVAAGTPTGVKAKAAMDAGELVSDDIVLALIDERLQQDDAQAGFILDGFPRNLTQANALDKMLDKAGKPIESAILVDVDFEVLTKRLTGRRSCKSCGSVFNVYFVPPATEGVCDRCGGELYQRDDDNEATIGPRLKTYKEQTAPLIEYYNQQNKLSKVEGVGEVGDIFAQICVVLEAL